MLPSSFARSLLFRSTLPCGERPLPMPPKPHFAGFDPRSRAGSDGGVESRHAGLNVVSIHAPVRGATRLQDCRLGRQTVSIHAPVRGATISSFTAPLHHLVSIHAPVRGATRRDRHRSKTRTFRSTLPCGERQAYPDCHRHHGQFRSTLPCGERRRSMVRPFDRGVSIHAPVRGATCASIAPPDPPHSFDPRSRAGSDGASLIHCHGRRNPPVSAILQWPSVTNRPAGAQLRQKFIKSMCWRSRGPHSATRSRLRFARQHRPRDHTARPVTQ